MRKIFIQVILIIAMLLNITKDKKGDMITVILPQFVVKHRWQNYLHNRTRLYVEKQLLRHKHIVVSVMPLQLKDDNVILNNYKK
jgi:hypothetical protein